MNPSNTDHRCPTDPHPSPQPGSVRSAFPAVSVVIPYYNAPDQLLRVLTAVVNQDYPGPVQIIVADDGSTPPAHEDPQLQPTLHRLGATVVWQPDQGFRAAAARNLGATGATGEVLAFFDGDTCPEPGFLRATVPHITANPRALVVGSRLTGPSAEEPEWLRHAWHHTDHLRAADDTSWRFIISAAMVCSRSFFTFLSGFDATLVRYGGEDWEFAWRAWNHGAQFVHEPAAIAIHPQDDFGLRFGDRDETIRRKNFETTALATRITHPMCRPQFGLFEVADIGVVLPKEKAPTTATAWQRPGVSETVIASWLQADVQVYMDGEVPALFAADPRVRQLDGSEGQGHAGKKRATEAPNSRIQVRLAEPLALENVQTFYAAVTDRMVQLPDGSDITTARGVALELAVQRTTPEQAGLRPVDGPQQLERLFAGW